MSRPVPNCQKCKGKERMVGHRHLPLQEQRSSHHSPKFIQVHPTAPGPFGSPESSSDFWRGQSARGSAKLAQESLNQRPIGKTMACYLGKMTQPKSSGKLRAKRTALQQNKASGAESSHNRNSFVTRHEILLHSCSGCS